MGRFPVQGVLPKCLNDLLSQRLILNWNRPEGIIREEGNLRNVLFSPCYAN
jgi:hypothetical protein